VAEAEDLFEEGLEAGLAVQGIRQREVKQ